VDTLEATNIYLTAHLLQEVADTVYGTENTPVAFDSSHPASTRLGRYWSSLARLAADTVDSGAFEAPLVRADLTRHLAVAMLECFPLAGDRELRSLSMAAQTRRYRIAKQFFDDHAHQAITVEDAARAANTTSTTLAQAFRANHPRGLSPAGYLRRARLAGAHADLLVADPTAGDTVAAVAARWGFAHPGRFARHYRAAYGVLPSATLRR
jgi:AraC-like DNA-binding protein